MNRKVPFLYKFGKLILGPIFKWYYHPTIIGKENIPQDGSILIVGNHKHLYDQCLTIIATKRGIHYMAKREYFDDKKVAWFFKGTGCISVDRSKKDEHATDLALSVLKDGGAIGLFPEGTRNKTESFLLPFKFGAVSMAKKTDSYLVPFGITGDYKFRSKNLTIRYGNPFKVNNMDLEEANNKLYYEVEMLMKQNLDRK
ncbi:MAG: 1-acyl-sn-glycerol-3-phosphate acyltransferase [Bacilli bacterium]|nr:1-acyl-sn-glycerol-3-phosphate acyltransferase [Bacilli bacterium]